MDPRGSALRRRGRGGDFLFVTSWKDDQQTGAVYVYQYDGSSWVEIQKLTKGISSNQFGRAVAADGTAMESGRAVIGDSSDSGGVFVYEFNGAFWVQSQELVRADVASGRFGFDVSLRGEVIGVGAPLADFLGPTDHGAVWTFRHDGSSFVEDQVLTSDTS